MQDLSNYSNIQTAVTKNEKFIEDLIAISNLKAVNIDTTIVEISGNNVKIEGDRTSLVNEYVVLGHEIAYITAVSYSDPYTTLTLAREQLGTKQDTTDLTGYYIRSVDIFTNVKSWEYNSYSSSKTQVFPFNLENGQVVIYDSISNWGKGKTYSLKRKKSAIYIFKGFDGEKMLKYVGFADNKSLYGAKYNDAERVKIEFNDKFIQWYNVNIRRQQILKYIKPKEFMVNVLEYSTDMVKYINGNIEDDFNTTNYVFLNEYSKFKDILGEYAKTGVRFYFNELEELCITTDLTISNLTPTGIDITNTNLLDIQKSDEAGFVINKVTGTYYERTALYDFENPSQFDNKYVVYGRTLDVDNFTLLNSDDEYNLLAVTDTNLANFTTQYDLVILKDNTTGFELHGKIIYYEGTSPNVETIISFQNADKDGWLDYFGRLEYLKSLDYDIPQNFTLHYVRNQLPIIYKHSNSFSEDTKNSRLNIALRPQITGQSEVVLLQTSAKFGATADLTNAKYTGQFENIDNIYGTFDDGTSFGGLTYNKELVQFTDPNNYPPLFVLSNRQTNDLGRGESVLLTFDTFDNSNLEINISGTDSSNYNAKINFKNTITIADTLLYDILKTNRTQITGSVFEINATDYGNLSVGDVLTLKQPTSYTDSDERAEFDANKDTNWIIERLFIDGTSYYMQLNGDIKDTFDFTTYPSNSIVYLQEFYILGNPVIEYTSGFESSNDTSIEEYDEQEQVIDGKLLNFEGVGKLTDYYKRGFAGIETNESDKKYILPLQIRNHPELQKFDLITITDDIYTGYDGNTDFMILGIEESDVTKGDTNKYYVMNINNFDATETTFDVEKLLDFVPVNDITYNSQGNEGLPQQTDEVTTDTNIITSNDSVYGSVSIKPIGQGDLKADVVLLEDGLLSIDNIVIGDTKYTSFLDYTTTDNEYKVIQIDNEYLLTRMESYSSVTDTANLIIVKRNFLNNISTATNIVEDRLVSFFEIISGSFDGDLITQNLKAGQQDDFMKFDMQDGTQISSTSNINFKTLNGGNTISELNFDKAGTNSYLKLNYDGSYYQFQAGKGLVDSTETFNGLFAGNGDLTQNNYLKYDGTTLSLKGNVDISGGSVDINAHSSILKFTESDSYIRLNYDSGLSSNYGLRINETSSDNKFIFDSDEFTIISQGIVDISNTNNEFYFGILATDSYIRMNNNKIKIGDDAISTSNGLYVADNSIIESAANAISLNTDTGDMIFKSIGNIDINTNDFTLITQGIVDISNNTNYNRLYMDIAGSYLHLNTNGTATTSDILQLGDNTTTNFMKYNTSTGLDLKSTGIIDISNTNNSLLFAPTGTTSYLKLATINGTGGEFQVGQYASSNYLKFSNTNGVELKTNTSVEIVNTAGGIANELKFDGSDSYIRMNDSTIKLGYNAIGSNYGLYVANSTSTNVLSINADTGAMILKSTGSIDFDSATISMVTDDFTLTTAGDITIDGGTTSITTDDFTLQTTGIIDISNTNNALYFDPVTNGDTSFIKLNKSTTYYSQQLGYCTDYITGVEDKYNGAFIGDAESTALNYLKYKDGTLSIKGDITITGGNATVTFRQDEQPTDYKTGDIWVDTDADERSVYVSMGGSDDLVAYGAGLYGAGYYGTNWRLMGTNNSESLTYTTVKIGKDAVDVGKYGFLVTTSGWVDINNINNRLYFDPINIENSYLKIATDGSKGSLEVGDITSNSYFKYSSGGLDVKTTGTVNFNTNDFSLTTTGILDIGDSSNKLYMDLTDSYLYLNNDTIKIGANAVGTNSGLYVADNSSWATANNGIQVDLSGSLDIKSEGTIDISNTNNSLFFETGTTNRSYIKLNKSTNYCSQQIGKVEESSKGFISSYNGLFCGNPENGSTEYLKYDGTNFTLTTAGDITISNNNNLLNFDGGTDTSYLKLNKTPTIGTYYNQQIGSGLEDNDDNSGTTGTYEGWFVGDADAMSHYIKYHQTNEKFSIKVDEIDIQQNQTFNGIEKSTNPYFTSSSDYTFGGNWSFDIVNDRANHTTSIPNDDLTHTGYALQSGSSYKIIIEGENTGMSTTTLGIYNGSTITGYSIPVGVFTKELEITASSNFQTYIRATSFVGYVIRFSILEITDNNVTPIITFRDNEGDVSNEVRISESSKNNLFFGKNCGLNNTVGSNITAIGGSSLRNNEGGSDIISIGYFSTYEHTIGDDIVAIGNFALQGNLLSGESGYQNIAIGSSTLQTNTTGNKLVAVGYQAGASNFSGVKNTYIGSESGFTNSGDENTLIGYNSARTLSSGDQNIVIGSESDVSTSSDTNSIVIGYNATGNGTDTTTIGNSSTTDTYIQGILHADIDNLNIYETSWTSISTNLRSQILTINHSLGYDVTKLAVKFYWNSTATDSTAREVTGICANIYGLPTGYEVEGVDNNNIKINTASGGIWRLAGELTSGFYKIKVIKI